MTNSLWWWWESAWSGSAGAHAATQSGINFQHDNLNKESWTELSASITNALHVAGKTGVLDWAFGNVMVDRLNSAEKLALHAEMLANKVTSQAVGDVESRIIDRFEHNILPEVKGEMAVVRDAVSEGLTKTQDVILDVYGKANQVATNLKIWKYPVLPHYTGPAGPGRVHGLTEQELLKLREMHGAEYEGGKGWYPNYDATAKDNPIEQKLFTRLKPDVDRIPECTDPLRFGGPHRQGPETETWNRSVQNNNVAGQNFRDTVSETRVYDQNLNPKVTERTMTRTLEESDARYFKVGGQQPARTIDEYSVKEFYDADQRCIKRVGIYADGTLTESISYDAQGEVAASTRTLEAGGLKYESTRIRVGGTSQVTSFKVNGQEVLKEKLLLDAPPDKNAYLLERYEAKETAKTAAEDAARAAAQYKADLEAYRQGWVETARRAAAYERELKDKARAARLAEQQDLLARPKAPMREVDPTRMKEGTDPSIFILNMLEHTLLVLLLLTGLGDPDEGDQLVKSKTPLKEAYNALGAATASTDQWSGGAAQAYNDANDALVRIAAKIGIDGLTLVGEKALVTKLRDIVQNEANGWLSGVQYTRMVLSIILGVVMVCQGIALKIARLNPMWSYAFQMTVVTSLLTPSVAYFKKLQRLSEENALLIAGLADDLCDLRQQVDEIAAN